MRGLNCLMDFSKIQTDLIKAATKDNRLIDYRYGVGTIDGAERVVIISNENTAFFIPKPLYYLDNEKLFGGKPPLDIAKTCLFKEADAERLTLSNELEVIPGTKDTLQVFRNGDEKIFVSKKLLDAFKTTVEINFKGSDFKSPVFIYSYSYLVGLVLPVNRRGGA